MSKRRGRGEGSIYQRADGIWCATATTGYTQTGGRRRTTIYGKTKASVQEKLMRMQSAHLDGVVVEPKRMNIATYLDHWLEVGAKPTVREKTFVRYEGIVRMYIKPYIGGTPLSQLQPSQVQALYTRLEQDGVSASTRGHTHAVLRRALAQALKWDYVVRNVCDAVTKPRIARKAVHALSVSEVARFLLAAVADRYYALWVLAIVTGMRLGELLGLDWRDVDLKEGAITVRHTLIEVSNKRVLGETKTSKGRRRIELPAMAVTALREHRERMFAEGHANLWVFCDLKGGTIRQANIRTRNFRRILVAANLPHMPIHDLRHTSATLLLGQGVHPKIVQERLGHSQISMTLDTYSHVLPSMQKAAAATLDELLTKPRNENGYSLATESADSSPRTENTNPKVRDITTSSRHAQRDSNPRHSVPKTDALSS
jgi:integrase